MSWPKWLVDEKDGIAVPVPPNTPLPPIQQAPQQQFGTIATMVVTGLDQAAQEKWSKFFKDLLASKGDPQYRQFTMMADGMVGIPDQMKYQSIFNGLKTTGLTKTSLAASAQATVDTLNKDAEQFKTQMDQKRKDRVDDPGQQVLQKQQQIEQLQKEIADLTTGTQLESQKINTSMLGYSTYFKQAQAKVANDLLSINQFIQE